MIGSSCFGWKITSIRKIWPNADALKAAEVIKGRYLIDLTGPDEGLAVRKTAKLGSAQEEMGDKATGTLQQMEYWHRHMRSVELRILKQSPSFR